MDTIKKIVHIINRQSPSIGDPKSKTPMLEPCLFLCQAIMMFVFASILCNGSVYADYTISMTTSGAHSIDVMPGAGGETGTSISEDAITVTTTCPSGYNLTLSTSVNDNNLYLGGNSSNNTTGAYFTPADGTTALSNAANTWGYYYESSNSNNTAPTKTSIFNPVPVKGSATTIKTSTSTSDSFSVYYGVAVSSSMAPGTYKMIPDTNNAGHDGAIVYQLTMSQSCLPYTVVFNPTSTAGGTTVTGTSTMSDQIIPAGVATALNSNTFTAPTGYEFDGWNTAQDGTGTSYTDGQSVTDLTTGGTSITLYAQWKKLPYMQDMPFSECTTTPKTVYDKRDNQAYTVAKLDDGKCWMTTNLNLAGGTTLNASDSNVPSDNYYTLPASSASGFSDDTTAYVYNSGNTTSTCTSPGCYSYYSWLAATAGGKDSSGNSVTSNGHNAAYSICPKGWRLPTSTTSNASATSNNNWKTGDWYALATAYGANLESNYYNSSDANFYTNAGPGTTPNFLLAGGYTVIGLDVSFNGGGSFGAYWSSTKASGLDGNYWLEFSSGFISTATSIKGSGASVRCVKEPINLYNAVASMSKGTQTLAQLRAAITVPTSADRTQDTSNSGVYEYNTSVFGAASDAASTSKIYYYRGVLENSVGSYGSDGSAITYPNYVILDADGTKDTSDTCWRIVRTTGSGGVKMIYNGKWTGSTCANATTNAQVTTQTFNGTSSTYRQIVRVGYTYNSTYATNTSKSGTIAQIFGTNSTPSVNDTRSTIKQYIEDTWYPITLGASGSNYTSILEPSAGYCNDRTMNTSTSWTSPLAESTTIASTYGTSGQQVYYFGAYPRNANAAQSPSLTCGNRYSQIDRSTVDLYRYVSGSNGVSNQLKYPVALLTADEAAFAGSGYSSSTTPYHANSYLRSGSSFWLLSPDFRNSNGRAGGFYLVSDGYLYNNGVNYTQKSRHESVA